MENERCYRIIRFFKRDDLKPRTIITGLTLAEAQEWCGDPETSSNSAISTRARRRTKRYGDWFDGFDLMKGIKK